MFKGIDIKSKIKAVKPALVFYLTAAMIIYSGELMVPSDMCNPGFGILLLIILLPLLSSGLFIKNLIQDFTSDTIKLKAPTIFHFLVSFTLWIWIYT